MDSIDYPPLKPAVVLGVAAHPDDLDFGAGGTLASFAQQGAAVHYLILTDGSKGTSNRNTSSEELVKTRQNEQQAALEAIGGQSVQFLAYPDGGLEVSMSLKKDIVRVIRQLKPGVVVTMDPAVLYAAERGFINHPDHRAAGQATLDAVYPLARDHLSFPELLTEGLEPHKVATVLLINFGHDNFHYDISDCLDRKMTALAAHASQFTDLGKTQSMVRDWAREAGQAAGCEFAESFVRLDVRD